jgi:hypothetical protein
MKNTKPLLVILAAIGYLGFAAFGKDIIGFNTICPDCNAQVKPSGHVSDLTSPYQLTPTVFIVRGDEEIVTDLYVELGGNHGDI